MSTNTPSPITTQHLLAIAPLLILLTIILLLRRHTTHPTVLSVSRSPTHALSKTPTSTITLLTALGVQDDCHQGLTVQHLSRMKGPESTHPPNLRQVHLMQMEVLSKFGVQPGEIGENVTTVGVDLLGLGVGTKLRFVKQRDLGDEVAVQKAACVVVRGLRNPCPQIEKFREGLQERFLERDEQRNIQVRKAGVMGTVENGGVIEKGMMITIERPKEFEALGVV